MSKNRVEFGAQKVLISVILSLLCHCSEIHNRLLVDGYQKRHYLCFVLIKLFSF